MVHHRSIHNAPLAVSSTLIPIISSMTPACVTVWSPWRRGGIVGIVAVCTKDSVVLRQGVDDDCHSGEEK